MKRVPRMRFKGFSKQWKWGKLGNCCNITTGKLDANAMVKHGKYDFYTCSTQKYKIDTSAFRGPAITVAGNGNVGFMHLADGEFNAYQRTYVLTSFSQNREYLYEEIGNRLPKKIAVEARRGNIPYIVMDMLTELEILLPDLPEQEKIGAFFSMFDAKIKAQADLLEKLIQGKKGLLQAMFPAEGEREPRMRVKGCKGKWKRKRLGDCFVYLQNNTLSRAELSLKGVAKNIHYGDVLIKYGTILDIKKEKVPMIKNQAVIAKYKASFLQNGDVILADTAEDDTVGKCTEIQGITDEIVISGLHTIPYRPLQKFGARYLGYYMNSNAYHKQLYPYIQGTKVSSVSKKALKDTIIMYPKDIKEQQRIGEILSMYDYALSLHKLKLEQLKQVKKAFLQAMFPAVEAEGKE